jgi:hypothetical protein
MALYRGPGGSGDATADSASEALLVRELAAEVAIDAAAAEAAKVAAQSAQAAAELAETNAETAETNAETAEANAETAEANAETAQTAAEAAQAAAETAQTAAELAETNAETAETNAEASATAAASSASAASTSASNAATSATNASNSATAAATSATNSANSATASATSATNASNSATAAATSATNAANSATAAQTAETNAETAETNAETAQAAAEAAQLAAETAETNAETAETNAAASASAAATSATNASNSASAASTSASNASTSASNASTSEIAAAASAAAAAASYDSFDDRYLGAKSADPTLDNDGNALIAGALYYNDGTVTAGDKGMYVYDGSQWIAASAASTSILVVYKYTATSGQTTFSGNDDNSVALAYTAGSIIVTLNGVVLESGSEYTATTGTSVVLTTGAATGDELNIHAFSTFDIANVYTQTQSDATFLTKSNPNYTGTLTGGTGVVNLGSGQVYKDASGNLGIGTSSPNSVFSNYKSLYLNGTSGSAIQMQYGGNLASNIIADNNALYLQNITAMAFGVGGTGTGTERMRIDSSGNVGIGTSSPSNLLSVVSNTNAQSWVGLRNNNAGSSATTGVLLGNDGSAALGSLFLGSSTYASFAGANGLNIGTYSTNPFAFFTNNTERMRIDSSGNVGIGTSSPVGNGTTLLHINGTVSELHLTATASGSGVNDGLSIAMSSDSNAYFYNKEAAAMVFGTSNAERMRLNSGGGLSIGTTTASPTNGILLPANGVLNTNGGTLYSTSIAGSTTAAGANMYVDATNGFIQRSTSSIKYKTNVEDLQQSISENIYKMRPVWYRSKGELDNKDWSYYGLIAEEVAEIEPRLVHWSQKDENGKQEPEGLMYDRLTVLLLAEMKKQQAQLTDMNLTLANANAIIQSQADTITAMELRLTALENK